MQFVKLFTVVLVFRHVLNGEMDVQTPEKHKNKKNINSLKNILQDNFVIGLLLFFAGS